MYLTRSDVVCSSLKADRQADVMEYLIGNSRAYNKNRGEMDDCSRGWRSSQRLHASAMTDDTIRWAGCRKQRFNFVGRMYAI